MSWPGSRSAIEQPTPDLREAFAQLRDSEEMKAERKRTRPHLEAEPDKTIGFLAEMDMGDEETGGPTPARCTRRSSRKSPAIAPSAG